MALDSGYPYFDDKVIALDSRYLCLMAKVMAFECGYTCLLDIATVLHNVSLVVPYHL